LDLKQKGFTMLVSEIKQLIESGELDYGSVWSEEKLTTVFGIEMPDLSGDATSILKNAREYDLKKLSAYCSINEQLLNYGKCFIQDGNYYRVPIISEMQSSIDKYYSSSNRKFKRAERLRKSFSELNPLEAKKVNDKVSRTISMRETQNKAYQPMA